MCKLSGLARAAQGGPGASALLGNFYELGPYHVTEDLQLRENPGARARAGWLQCGRGSCRGLSLDEHGDSFGDSFNSTLIQSALLTCRASCPALHVVLVLCTGVWA